MKRPERSFLALLLLLGVSHVGAQSTAQRDFEKRFGKSQLGEKLEALKELVGSGDPAAVKVILEKCFGVSRDLAETRRQYKKVGEKLHEEKAKVTNVPLTASQNQQATKKIQPLQREHQELETEVEQLDTLRTALIESVGPLVDGCADEQRTQALLFLAQTLERARKNEDKADVIASIGYVKDPRAGTSLLEAFTLGRVPALRVAALEAMAEHPAEAMVPTVLTGLRDESWQVRSASLAFLKKAGGKESIEPLLDALEREEGRLITEVMDTLTALTKVNKHDNVPLWRDWWSKHKDQFEGRGKSAGVKGSEVAEGPGTPSGDGAKKGNYFYGINTRSKHIIYVLDISGSMRWTLEEPYRQGQNPPPDAPPGKSKLDSALKELLSSIAALPEDGTFNIVFYNIEVSSWKKKVQKAAAAAKSAAQSWAKSIRADGATNIFDALERAFGMIGRGSFDKEYGLAADTIFFLSDGQSNAGRVVNPPQMLREVRALNSLARVQIHCVGLGEGTDVRFLEALAKQNNGQFVHISARAAR